MSVLRVMSRRGDDRVAWDVKQVEVGDPEAIAAAGRALFDAFERDAPVRLLGVGVSNLVHPDKRAGPAAGDEAPEAGPVQLALD